MKCKLHLALKTKKALTQICTGLFFLFAGIEYAVILPTLNDYLKSPEIDAQQFFLGMVLSAFSLSGVLMAPVFGIWYDRTHRTKFMILFANMWEIAGNILYFIGENKYYILGGRFLAGIGAGVGSAIFANVAQRTTEAERAASISVLMAARQIGMLFGPGLNLALEKCDFYIGRFPVNKYTSPGVFMAVMWILLQFVFMLLYFDIPILAEQKKIEDDERSSTFTANQDGEPCMDYATLSNGSLANNASINAISSNGGIVAKEEDPTSEHYERAVGQHGALIDVTGGITSEEFESALPQEEQYMQHPNGGVTTRDEEDEKGPGFCWSLNECLREEVVVLLAVQFVFYFNQPGLETAVVPLNEKYLKFDEIGNSIFYCVCGVELLFFFVLVKMMSKKVSDRMILLIGVIIETISLMLLCILIPRAIPGDVSKNLPMFITSCLIQVSGLAFLAVSIITLFSKVVPDSIQGFSQGVRRAVGGVATILGPLWSGATVEKPFIMLIVMVALFVLALVMVLVSWKRLKTNSQQTTVIPSARNIIGTNEETEPLLPNNEIQA